MQIVGRHDLILIGGLTTAMVVVFSKPIQYMLDYARQIEASMGLSLLPALIILTVVFVFQQQAKRQETHAEALAAAAEARQAVERAHELEQLVVFGHALAGAVEMEHLRGAVMRHLPKLVGDLDTWVLIRNDNQWDVLVGASQGGAEDIAAEALARWSGDQNAELGRADFFEREGYLCAPLMIGSTAIGVLGVVRGSGEFSESCRRILPAAGALLAIAIKNVQLFGEIRESGLRDGLTGCMNRTHALDMVETELRRARRTKAPTALLMVDIDHFKSINDRYGHLCGDAVLGAVGRRIREVLRTSDIKCRYGGEEFLILLPDTPLSGAAKVADALRLQIADMRIRWNAETLRVTASIGLGMALSAELDVQALIGRADAALYRAKAEGRNRVVVADAVFA